MRLGLLAGVWVLALAGAAAAGPLVSHRAGYEISLANPEAGGQASGPVAASGLIAYEFRGSACEGYASNFRQLTQLRRSEGASAESDIRALSYEDGEAKSLKFEITTRNDGADQPTISGAAARGVDGRVAVDLMKPAKDKAALGEDILFPTQHIARILAQAQTGGRVLEARVFDGSDTGKKVYATLSIIGARKLGLSADSAVAGTLAQVARWPVIISYFDASKADGAPEYTMSFDLYENGVSGSLKLDYGTFALTAKLKTLDFLPSSACTR